MPNILKYLNLEVSTGKIINAKENINIRCRLNSTEDYTWHTPHSQLNLIVDLIHNFYITWGKRQDDLDLKLERLSKEYQQVIEKYSLIQNKISFALHILEEVKSEQNKISKNSDYIKEEAIFIKKNSTESAQSSKDLNIILEVKRLVEDLKSLILS